jgi:hypothetical protein
MFRDFTQIRDDIPTRTRPPDATTAEFTHHPDIDTTQSELLTASLNSRLLSRLVLAGALRPISYPPPSAARAVTSTAHLHSGHSALLLQKPTPPAFKIKMTAKGSSQHVGTFPNDYTPHATELCCSMSYQFALELQ